MNFRRWVVFTFLIHVLVVAVDKGGGLILYLLTVDHSEENGEASIVASLPFILGAVANLGLATSLVYFVRRGRFTAQQAFETSLSVALAWGGCVGVGSFLAMLYVVPAIDPDWRVDPWLVAPICAVVPVLLVSSYANSTQLATERVKDYGVVHLVTSLAFLPAFLGLFFVLGADVDAGDVPYAVSWGRLASSLVVVALTLWLVRSVVRVRLGFHGEFLREGLRYGWKANLTSTLTYLNHRLDLLMVVAFYVAPAGLVGKAADDAVKSQVAFYSLAVTWAELVWHFPEAMRDLFFSKVAGSSREQARALTPVLSRLGLSISLVGAVAIVLLVDPTMGAITWLAKGSSERWFTEWSPTVTQALWILVPGTAAFTVSKVLQADLAARNELQACINAQVTVLAVMLALDVLWIPAYGAVGAAAASTVAYVVATVYVLLVYARQTKTPLRRCLLIEGGDLRHFREILAAVIAKLRRRTT